MKHFWIGFSKTAAKLPVHKHITYVTSQRHLADRAMTQTVPKGIVWLIAKLKKIPVEKAREQVVTQIEATNRNRGVRILGTIGEGPSGRKHIYIEKSFAERAHAGKEDRTLHNVIHHETFHSKVPVIGSSEILAHAYGGLRSHPGTLTPSQSVKDLGTLLKVRPGRAALEVGAGIGAYKGGKKLYKKYQEHEARNEKRASDVLKEWIEESKAPFGKSEEEKKQKKIDPVTLSAGYTPDTYWRSWP